MAVEFALTVRGREPMTPAISRSWDRRRRCLNEMPRRPQWVDRGFLLEKCSVGIVQMTKSPARTAGIVPTVSARWLNHSIGISFSNVSINFLMTCLAVGGAGAVGRSRDGFLQACSSDGQSVRRYRVFLTGG
jgi:hypothetical protein